MTIAVVSTGAFGGQVAALLSDYAGAPEVVPTRMIDAAFDVEDALVVVATWRPSPPLCARADELSFVRGTPWLPVVMEHRQIMIGPLVRPPAGPCYRCFVRRRTQHDIRYSETVAADNAFSEDQEAGPRGHMPYHARIAASLAMRIARIAHARPAALAGPDAVSAAKVLGYDLIAGDISVSGVLRCHDCDRCTGRAQPAITLGEILSYLRA